MSTNHSPSELHCEFVCKFISCESIFSCYFFAFIVWEILVRLAENFIISLCLKIEFVSKARLTLWSSQFRDTCTQQTNANQCSVSIKPWMQFQSHIWILLMRSDLILRHGRITTLGRDCFMLLLCFYSWPFFFPVIICLNSLLWRELGSSLTMKNLRQCQWAKRASKLYSLSLVL